MTVFDVARRRLVTEQLIGRDITDVRVLAAMGAVKREIFVSDEAQGRAYLDGALPIGAGQTISQPYIVALMAQALCLDGTEHLLDVGGGCGYSAAVYGQLAATVDSYEIVPSLAEHAKINIEKAGAKNVHIFAGDATAIEGEELYDVISVAAAPASVPGDLIRLLKKGGRMVIPVGPRLHSQELLLIHKDRSGGLDEKILCAVGFVPLIVRQDPP